MLTMACPKCGGEFRKAIAPSYWECTTVLAVRLPTGVPHPALGPQWIDRPVMCGHRYPEGAPAMVESPLCSCGTYAIGRCQHCGQHVCGDCSQFADGQRLCAVGIETRTAQMRARMDAATAQREESIRAAAEARANEHAERVNEVRARHGPAEPIREELSRHLDAARPRFVPNLWVLIALVVAAPFLTVLVGAVIAHGSTAVSPGPYVLGSVVAAVIAWTVWLATAIGHRNRIPGHESEARRLRAKLGCGREDCDQCRRVSAEFARVVGATRSELAGAEHRPATPGHPHFASEDPR